MKPALLALLLCVPAAAGDLGGHEPPKTALATPASDGQRRATLEELWRRGILPPDQSGWSPDDFVLLLKIREAERDARAYLRRRFGGERPWLSRPGPGALLARDLLTKKGYEAYVSGLTQDAIAYFELKGADAKRMFKLRDWDDKPLFDSAGRITPEGARVYRRATLDLEVFWKDPEGGVFGTRRPPTKKP